MGFEPTTLGSTEEYSSIGCLCFQGVGGGTRRVNMGENGRALKALLYECDTRINPLIGRVLGYSMAG
jgi:hypothetical protein